MTARHDAIVARAAAMEAARTTLREYWGKWTTERIGSFCGITTIDVRALARDMNLPVKERSCGRRRVG